MSSHILAILMLFTLTSQKVVVGLNCYATDLAELRDHGNMKTKLQECKEIIQEAIKYQQRPQVSLDALDNVELRCYNIHVEAESKTVDIKGCLPKGGCEPMKAIYKLMIGLKSNGKMGKADCYECDGNGCNVHNSAGLVRQNVFVVSLTLFLAYMNTK